MKHAEGIKLFGKWISIKDNLPADNNELANEWDWVLVATEIEGCTTWAIAHYTKQYGWSFWGTKNKLTAGPRCGDAFDYIGIKDITHWMPIPEIEDSDQ